MVTASVDGHAAAAAGVDELVDAAGVESSTMKFSSKFVSKFKMEGLLSGSQS